MHDRTLQSVLTRQAATYGDRPLLRFAGETWTYRDALEAAATSAHALLSAGLEPGDRIALMSANSLDLFRVWLGAGWAGLVVVPVNAALRGAQLERVFVDSGARAIAIEAALVPKLDALESDLVELERIWTIDEPSATTSWRGRPVAPVPSSAQYASPHESRPDDTLTIFYTGGTTGPSRGVCCSHTQSYWWGTLVSGDLGVAEGDVLHTTLPLFHTNGLHTFWQALLNGATFSFGARFSASAFWGELAATGATVTYLLGTMVEILLRREPTAQDKAHDVRIALAPGTSAEATRLFAERFGVEIVNAYGSTETNLITSTRQPGSQPGTMGRVTARFEVIVADADDHALPPGTPGELLVRSREPFSLFSGYWRDEKRTLEATRNLWFHTGDQVVQEPDGSLRFLDRKRDAIRRRGENISSWEVEQALLTHPRVVRAAVVPVPSELGEDDVLAVVVAMGAEPLDPLELLHHCESRLAYFAIPRYVEFAADLPETGVGRTRKFLLRERGIGPHTWDRESVGYQPAKG